ncbi:MAG: hypothetical protein AAF710_05935 [Planctomycetota bacterium]
MKYGFPSISLLVSGGVFLWLGVWLFQIGATQRSPAGPVHEKMIEIVLGPVVIGLSLLVLIKAFHRTSEKN